VSNAQEQERKRFLTQYSEIATLAGGLAHEIKNPLSIISMNLELLNEELEQGDSSQDRRMLMKIETVQRECHHLENILDAFLQFARVGELELVEWDLNQIVRDFIEFYQPKARERRIEISPHLGSDLPPVRLDPALVRQVFMNLTLNAEQAMLDGGLLELQTYFREGRVYLEFIDNGTGMDEQTNSKKFQVFFSTKTGGSGLGLVTVKKIVEAHHGTISCDSESGRGTKFTISLPAADAVVEDTC